MNARPPAPKAGALPGCATPRHRTLLILKHFFWPCKPAMLALCTHGRNLRVRCVSSEQRRTDWGGLDQRSRNEPTQRNLRRHSRISDRLPCSGKLRGIAVEPGIESARCFEHFLVGAAYDHFFLGSAGFIHVSQRFAASPWARARSERISLS